MLAKDYPDSLLNTFIYVFWVDDKVWYRARVVKYLEITKKFKVIYDDKNEEKVDLLKEQFLLEDDELKQMAEFRRKQLKNENRELRNAFNLMMVEKPK
jgi:hypothetical protein